MIVLLDQWGESVFFKPFFNSEAGGRKILGKSSAYHQLMKCPVVIAAICLAGCATVAPSEKPKDAVELRGVVVDANVVPNYGPSGLQSQLAGAVGASMVLGIEHAARAKTLTVRVSDKLSLSVPVRTVYATGTCVLLAIDPLYKDLLAAGTGVMSMPTGSTFIDAVPCR